MNPKNKILYLIHTPPPIHGVSKISQQIYLSKFINNGYQKKLLRLNLSTQIEKISQRMDDLELKVERLYVPLPQTASQRRTEVTTTPSDGNPAQVIYTKKNIPEPTPSITNELPEEEGKDDRLVILQELSSLFQAKKNLDTKSPLGSLGTLGKKYKKSTKKEEE